MDECYYYGCWNGPGHFLYRPDGIRDHIIPFSVFRMKSIHIDSNFAPLRHKNGKIGFAGQFVDQGDRNQFRWESTECPQGQFLHHELDNGFSAIQWWDRCQGDTRPGCNSTILLHGIRTSEEMLTALHRHFPHVAANLRDKGVELVEVKAS